MMDCEVDCARTLKVARCRPAHKLELVLAGSVSTTYDPKVRRKSLPHLTYFEPDCGFSRKCTIPRLRLQLRGRRANRFSHATGRALG
jgi:hypothetical protein